jgi:hypothetical protein
MSPSEKILVHLVLAMELEGDAETDLMKTGKCARDLEVHVTT